MMAGWGIRVALCVLPGAKNEGEASRHEHRRHVLCDREQKKLESTRDPERRLQEGKRDRKAQAHWKSRYEGSDVSVCGRVDQEACRSKVGVAAGHAMYAMC
jgi:hypothetical protein